MYFFQHWVIRRFLISFLSISPLSVLILHFKISSCYSRAPFHKKAPIRMNYITSGFFCTPLVYVFPTHSNIKQGYRPVNLSADATALQKPQLSPKSVFKFPFFYFVFKLQSEMLLSDSFKMRKQTFCHYMVDNRQTCFSLQIACDPNSSQSCTCQSQHFRALLL